MEHWIGNHVVFKEGPKIYSGNNLFAEYRACAALGLDIDEYFKKDKASRMLIVGGYIADSAISSMRSHDIAEERARKAELLGKKKHR